ncbi:MAG: hypothetical protein AAF206_13235 [Bacteroidota bacterium]
MKNLIFFTLSILFGLQMQAQLNVHQVSEQETAASFAKAPQKFLSDLNQLRGFGSFLKVDQSHQNYDRLVKFSQLKEAKDPDHAIMLFAAKVIIFNMKGESVAESNVVKLKMFPGEYTKVGGLSFPGDIFRVLDEGTYELRLSASPIEDELKGMVKHVIPDSPLRFTK